MPGLVRYAFGPGKSDEHTNQHIVAGSRAVESEWLVTGDSGAEWVLPVDLGGDPAEQSSDATGSQLTPREAGALGRTIEASWRSQHLESMALTGRGPERPRGGVSTADRHDSLEPEHVYHVTMSLHVEEGSYTDEQWQTLAREYVRGMGFETDDAAESCEWVAVRHGLSKEGQDHIHLAINLVRNNGERVTLRYDNPDTGKVIGDLTMTQRLRRDLEARHDFVQPLSERGYDTAAGTTKYSKAEARRASARAEAGRGNRSPDRVVLQRAVRGAAAASSTEAQFVQALRDAGVVATPRWAAGGREQVTGYSVALSKPMPDGQGSDADRGFRIAGSKLASDLSLTKLRTRWEQHETPQTRQAALRLWHHGATPSQPVMPDQELERAAAALGRWNDRLETMPATDRAAWATAGSEAAGMVSLVASRCGTEPELQPLAPISHRLTQAMWRDREHLPGPAPSSRHEDAAVAARHLNLALRAGGLSATAGWFAVLQQLRRTVRALEDARRAREDLVTVTGGDERELAGVGAWVQDNAATPQVESATERVRRRADASRPSSPRRPTRSGPSIPRTPGPDHGPSPSRDPGLGF